MPPTYLRLIVVGIALGYAGFVDAQNARTTKPQAAPVQETPGLKATQVTIAVEKDGKWRKFRATVMSRKDDVLTVLTAAHCIAADDKDATAVLDLDPVRIRGTVGSVVRNPSFKGEKIKQGREIPGPDNAVARFRFRPNPDDKPAIEALDALKPAFGLSNRAYPDPSGQVVAVRMLDARGVEHAVKAGNYSNPRYLEWGPAYKPIPGDSGGGVFVLNNGADGQVQPILIGIISGFDDKGGTASLVSREMRWIAEELNK